MSVIRVSVGCGAGFAVVATHILFVVGLFVPEGCSPLAMGANVEAEFAHAASRVDIAMVGAVHGARDAQTAQVPPEARRGIFLRDLPVTLRSVVDGKQLAQGNVYYDLFNTGLGLCTT